VLSKAKPGPDAAIAPERVVTADHPNSFEQRFVGGFLAASCLARVRLRRGLDGIVATAADADDLAGTTGREPGLGAQVVYRRSQLGTGALV